MRYWTTALLCLIILPACLVKPPSDDTDLGAAIDMTVVQAAINDAQAGVDPTKAYNVGDTGTILTINTVMGSSSIQETDLYNVTAVTPTTYTVTEHVVETNQDYQATLNRPTPLPTPKPSPSPTTAALFLAPFNIFAQMWNSFNRWISKIYIQPSTAIGDTPQPKGLLPSPVKLFASTSDISASPSPSPTPSGPVVTSDTYYRLIITPHQLLTGNCAQISNCMVSAINLAFEEIITTSDGLSRRLHWSYEFSKVVPGIFTLMDRCWTSVITQNGTQTPLTHCDSHVSDFRWGGGS